MLPALVQPPYSPTEPTLAVSSAPSTAALLLPAFPPTHRVGHAAALAPPVPPGMMFSSFVVLPDPGTGSHICMQSLRAIKLNSNHCILQMSNFYHANINC